MMTRYFLVMITLISDGIHVLYHEHSYYIANPPLDIMLVSEIIISESVN